LSTVSPWTGTDRCECTSIDHDGCTKSTVVSSVYFALLPVVYFSGQIYLNRLILRLLPLFFGLTAA